MYILWGNWSTQLVIIPLYASPPKWHGRNDCNSAEVIFKCIFFQENVYIFIQISLKFFLPP